jgi:uncharacterized membrane protein
MTLPIFSRLLSSSLMDCNDEIQRLCADARSLRLRAAMVAAQVAFDTYELRRTLAKRKALMSWSREMMSQGKESISHCPKDPP